MEALGIIGDLGLNVVEDEDCARCRKIFKFYDEDRDGKVSGALPNMGTHVHMCTCAALTDFGARICARS